MWSIVRRERAVKDLLEIGVNLDWTGQVLGEETPSSGGALSTDGARQTLHGVTIDFRKRNNMLYALIGREMGLEEVFVKRGPNALDSIVSGAAGSRDDEHTFESYEAGFDLFDGVSLADVMENRGIEMQVPDRWAARDWPSHETSDGALFRKAHSKLFELISDN